MSQADVNLTPAQQALQQLALRQMAAVQETLRRLESITEDQGDREAVRDANGSVGSAVGILSEWFGQEPDNSFQETR